jgi:hypothetical protein
MLFMPSVPRPEESRFVVNSACIGSRRCSELDPNLVEPSKLPFSTVCGHPPSEGFPQGWKAWVTEPVDSLAVASAALAGGCA